MAKKTFSTDEMVERIGKAIQGMDGKDIANLYNQNFGYGLTYRSSDGEFKHKTIVDKGYTHNISSLDEVIEQISESCQVMDGNELADLYNEQFGEGLTYLGDSLFEQDE